MKIVRFAWDANKSRLNYKKHGVTFEEAKTVFSDDHAELIYDPDHSTDEDRFILLGVSLFLRVVVVCHCYRESSSVIRIISARKATKNEVIQYEEKR